MPFNCIKSVCLCLKWIHTLMLEIGIQSGEGIVSDLANSLI